MARRSLVIAVLAAALSTTPAWAADAGVDRGVELGHRAFGAAKCGVPTVERAAFDDPAVMAGADPTACKILLNRQWVGHMTRAMRCTLVMHEYGHLAGREHNHDPDSVMFFEYRKADPRCLSTAARGRGTSGSARTSSSAARR